MSPSFNELLLKLHNLSCHWNRSWWCRTVPGTSKLRANISMTTLKHTHTHTHAQLDHSHPVISHGCTCWLGFNYLCDLPHKSPAPAGVCWYSMCVHCSGSLPTCVCFLLLAVWPKRTTTGWVICTEIVFVQGIEALWRLLCASTVGCTYSIIVNFF